LRLERNEPSITRDAWKPALEIRLGSARAHTDAPSRPLQAIPNEDVAYAVPVVADQIRCVRGEGDEATVRGDGCCPAAVIGGFFVRLTLTSLVVPRSSASEPRTRCGPSSLRSRLVGSRPPRCSHALRQSESRREPATTEQVPRRRAFLGLWARHVTSHDANGLPQQSMNGGWTCVRVSAEVEPLKPVSQLCRLHIQAQ
jgi:hypothetical protein